MKIAHKIKGWEYVLNDFAYHNELTDVRTINVPTFSDANISAREFYTFADFLDPGYHQILIYDPKVERAFCKEFVAKLNQRDFVILNIPNSHKISMLLFQMYGINCGEKTMH